MTISDDDITAMMDEELIARRTKVMYLKNAGATWAQISKETGVSVATCRRDMAIVQRDINNEQPHQVVARHRAVIFDIQRANYPAMMRGDKDAAAIILRALHREANLLGLDAPTRVLASVSQEDFANEAARLIESITSKDADTLKELTHAQRPIVIDAEPEEPEQPVPADAGKPAPAPTRRTPFDKPARRAEGPGPVDAVVVGSGEPPAGAGPEPSDRAPADAPDGQPGVSRPAGLPDDDDDWSNL